MNFKIWLKLWPKRSRADLIESKAQQIAANLVSDTNQYTEVEQAVIVKRVENVLLQRFTTLYDEAYSNQQRILEAKEKLK